MSSIARPAPLPVSAIVALCVLDHVALSGARLALALQALRLGAPSIGLGLMLAPFALASALGALPLGRLVDRVGARAPALAGMASMTIALALAAWRPTLAVLAAAAVPIGLGQTASLIALQSELARDRDERTRRAGLAGFAVGTAASGGFGPSLAGQCVAAGGASLAFGVLAALSFVALGAGGWQARRLPSLHTRRGPGRPRMLSAASLRGWRPLRRILLADLLLALAWNANGIVVPLLGQRAGWSADTAGNLLGTYAAAVLAARLLAQAGRARGHDWATIVRALLASGAALALLPLATTPPTPYLLEAVFGAGLGGSLPAVLALIERDSPPGRRAEVLGLRQSVVGLGAAALPAGLATAAALAGLGPALAGFGAALLGAAVLIAPRAGRAARVSRRR